MSKVVSKLLRYLWFYATRATSPITGKQAGSISRWLSGKAESHAVLRALELTQYAQLDAHKPGWVATMIGIDRKDEDECIRALDEAGLIQWKGNRYCVHQDTVDTGARPQTERRRLKGFWTEVAGERIHSGAEGLFSYNLFSVSRADLERLKEMHVQYFHAIRSLVANSSPSECVALANIQLFELRGHAS